MSATNCDVCSSSVNLCKSTDESYNLTRGDLGLGYGLKPGSIHINHNNISLPCCTPPGLRINIAQGENGINKVWMQSLTEPSENLFPTMDGVQIGTSIRQQKQLYEHNMREVNFKREQEKVIEQANGDDNQDMTSQELTSASKTFIHQKLALATQEVEVLHNELDACKSQLDSKYKAIRILQSQYAHAMLASTQHRQTAQSSNNQQKYLVKEVNALQFELDIKADAQLQSEHTWAERFDRMCLENAALMATLEARSDELRRIQAEKIVLNRQKDELLALMDVKDKLVFQKLEAFDKQTMDGFSASFADQLAVLGSCKCRCSTPDPCKCAKMAAHFRKESSYYKEQNEILKTNSSEAYSVADAYRIAFEEQLNRNTVLTKEVSNIHKNKHTTSNFNRLWKTKQSHMNGKDEVDEVQETYNVSFEEEYHPDRNARSFGVQVSEPKPPEFINLLTDLLNDRSEALAHQRLAAKLLANRMQDLEEILERLTMTESLAKM